MKKKKLCINKVLSIAVLLLLFGCSPDNHNDIKNNSPEFLNPFKDVVIKKIGSYYGNNVYVNSKEKPEKLSDGYGIHTYTSREDYVKIMMNSKGEFAVVDVGIDVDNYDKLDFKSQENDSVLHFAWEFGEGKNHKGKIVQGRSGKEWIYVDTISNSSYSEISELYVITGVHAFNSERKYVEGVVLKKTYDVFIFTKNGEEFRKISCDLLWSPDLFKEEKVGKVADYEVTKDIWNYIVSGKNEG